MNCPKCNSKLKVIDSRAVSDNSTYRRLECSVCKKRFTSSEKIVEYDEFFPAPAIDLNDILEVIARNSIVRNGFMSAVTGGIYPTEEEALQDSVSELKKLHAKEIFK